MDEKEQLFSKTPIEFAKGLQGRVQNIDLAHDMALAQAPAQEGALVARKIEQLYDSLINDPRSDTEASYNRRLTQLKESIERGDSELPVDTPSAVELSEKYNSLNPWQKELASRVLDLAADPSMTHAQAGQLEVGQLVSSAQRGQHAAYKWAKEEKAKQ